MRARSFWTRGEGVYHSHTFNEANCAVVDRFTSTLKSRMLKYFTANNTGRYTGVLQDLVEGYNKAYHRSIRMAPWDVNENIEDKVRQKLYGKDKNTLIPPKYKFKVRDLVRISKVKASFKKGYLPSWTEEIFKIEASIQRDASIYKLTDLTGENLAGTFYEPKLQIVTKSKDAYYTVEEIIKATGIKGRKKYFVKWLGWPSKFNLWVSAAAIKRL